MEKYASHSMVFLAEKHYLVRTAPDFSDERWQDAILAGNASVIIDDIHHYLQMPVPGRYINRALLYKIYHQLLRITYTVLEMQNIPSQQTVLHTDATLQESIFDSLNAFQHWVQETAIHTAALIADKNREASAVDILIRYIHEHLEHDLSRAELADIVHLHPDYLSALFRQKMNVSLLEYITKERITKAKQLLLTTDIPIGEIATRTGFQNISYFSKMFKRLEHLTPNQYRSRRGDKYFPNR